MSLSALIQVGIGMILVYYILSLTVSGITGYISQRLQLRAKVLEQEMEKYLGKDFFEKIKQRPEVSVTQQQQLSITGKVTTQKIQDIPKETLAQAALEVAAQEPATTESTDEASPKTSTRPSLIQLIQEGVKEPEKALPKVENAFDCVMTNISNLYGQHARRITLFVALAITLLLGVDSIAVARALWEEPTIRTAIDAQANAIAMTQTQQVDTQQSIQDIQATVSQLQSFDLPILWTGTLPSDGGGWLLKIAGLVITWVAVSRGSPFWYDLLKRARSS